MMMLVCHSMPSEAYPQNYEAYYKKHKRISDEFTGKVIENLNNFDTEFTVNLYGDVKACFNYNSQEIDGIMNDYARYNTDYIANVVSSINTNATYSYNKMTVKFNVKYQHSRKDHKDLMLRVKDLVTELDLNSKNKSEYEKIKIVNDYVSSLSEYDYTLKKFSAYTLLKTGSGVCQSYATLTYLILKEAGVGVRTQAGTLEGVGHLWNLVQVGGSWYHLDVTNNDINGDYRYLLKSSRTMKKSKFEWNQLVNVVSSVDFKPPGKLNK